MSKRIKTTMLFYCLRGEITIWPISGACGLRKLLTGSDVTKHCLVEPRIVLKKKIILYCNKSYLLVRQIEN